VVGEAVEERGGHLGVCTAPQRTLGGR
jgi:hypothetical protein